MSLCSHGIMGLLLIVLHHEGLQSVSQTTLAAVHTYSIKKPALKISLKTPHWIVAGQACSFISKNDSIAVVFLCISRNFSRPSFHRTPPGDRFSNNLIHLMYNAITPIKPLFHFDKKSM